MTDREFTELAESLKRIEARFEEFAAKMLAQQEQMLQMLQMLQVLLRQIEEARPVVGQVYHVGERVRTGDVADMVRRNIQRALVRQGSSIDAVGGEACKASTETLRP